MHSVMPRTAVSDEAVNVVIGCTYLWSVAMDSEKPNIASEARDFLVSLHLDLSEELQQQQASVRSTLIM